MAFSDASGLGWLITPYLRGADCRSSGRVNGDTLDSGIVNSADLQREAMPYDIPVNSTIPPTVHCDFRDQIAFLTLARPDKGNTMNREFGADFFKAAFIVKSNKPRAVVLSGEGKNFCFGGDLGAMAAAGDGVEEYLSELTRHLHEGIALLAAQPAPVIAAVQGFAAGAGLGLVLMADIVIAARSAKFTPAYTGVGLTPDAGCSFLLPRIIGARRAAEMLLTNRVLDAAQALEWGLINRVVEDGELAAAAAELAARLVAGPAHAQGVVKRLLAQSQSHTDFVVQMRQESVAISRQAACAEGTEGIGAFLAKRPPRF